MGWAAYDALINLDRSLGGIIDYVGVLISDEDPLFMEIVEFTHKEVKLFEEFVERLDTRSRMRMNASLREIAEATTGFDFAFRSHVEKLNESEKMSDLYFRNMQDLREDAHSLINRFKKMQEEYLKLDTHEDEVVDSKSNIIGLTDEYAKLKKEIIGRWVDEHVFSLVGMAGIGKTALAKKLFEDLDILESFDCRVWVTLGRKHQPEAEITQNILAQLGIDVHNTRTRNYLRYGLRDKRSLIVFDDVWDTDLVQHYLKTSLPKGGNGSRVLLTTRIQHDSFPYHLINMRLLNKEESWDLLSEKVFGRNSCPFELEETGKKIADKCDGLPLTIVTVADLLSKAEKTSTSLWIEVATQKKHQIFVDAYEEISQVLYPSYENLREDLKLCFLYMGVFPKNYQIPKSNLINLWIVEKIIKKGVFRTLEISGVECLQYLALHNVVMIHQRSTLLNDHTEPIKKCGLHSSWWHFCYKEAKKSNFFYILDSYSDASREVIKRQSRLTIHNNVLFGIKDVYKSMVENCASTTHSLLCLGPYHQYLVPICFDLKLLKKLDAQNIRFYEFPLEVLELVKLRYLALTCNASLPPSISKLWKLQYLIVNRHFNIKFGNISYYPLEIWDMIRLKHLHVSGSDLPHIGGTFLPNLLTLSDVSFESCTSGAVARIPNLKKLGIRIDLMPDSIEPLCLFDHISHLSKLESLKCVIVNPACGLVAPLVPFSMFPINLKNLCLSGLGYPWEYISAVSSLPNLEVLKLRSNAFQGPKWVVEDIEFPKLSFLVMEDIDLVILKGRNQSFQSLKKVSLKHCYKLRKFRLRSKYNLAPDIEVVDCNPLIKKEMQKSFLSADVPKHILIHLAGNS